MNKQLFFELLRLSPVVALLVFLFFFQRRLKNGLLSAGKSLGGWVSSAERQKRNISSTTFRGV